MRLTMQQALFRAEQAAKKGDVDFAKQLYAAVLRKHPAHVLAKKRLRELGKGSQRNQARPTGQTDPSPDQMNTIFSLFKSGEMRKAEQACKKLLAAFPRALKVYTVLGATLIRQGKAEQTLKVCDKAIQFKPDYAEAYNYRGIVHKGLGQLEEALKNYDKAIQLKPDYWEAYNNRALAFQDLGRLEEALKSYAKALQFKPDYAEAYNNCGNTLLRLGQLEEALKSYDRAIQFKPDYAEAYYNCGIAFKAFGQLEEAIKSYAKAIQLKPDYGEAHNNLGVVFQESGKLDKASEHYRKALLANPDLVEVYGHISSIKKYSEADTDVCAMEKIFNSKDSDDRQKMFIGFALGKVFEDLKQYKKSFECIKKANHLHRSSYNYSKSDRVPSFNMIKKIFSKEFFAVQEELQQESSENSDPRPIFILGMLRSGTTLVEQIIASHPYVFGAGELYTLVEVVNSLSRQKNIGEFPECISALNQDDFKRLGSTYLKKIAAFRSKDEIYITDKMPHNFLNIGLIKIILPRAKVVHCKRDPMDTCFSIFKKFFTAKNSHPYAYEMTELGHYYNLYADLMKHWSKLLPGYVYDIEYEKLVMDQEEQTRKLLSYCGLPWDDACIAFHKTRRRVSTASFVQVRQPIYKDSVELWKQHAKQLEPLRRAIHG